MMRLWRARRTGNTSNMNVPVKYKSRIRFDRWTAARAMRSISKKYNATRGKLP
jgi:hypothetical protein